MYRAVQCYFACVCWFFDVGLGLFPRVGRLYVPVLRLDLSARPHYTIDSPKLYCSLPLHAGLLPYSIMFECSLLFVLILLG